MRFVFCDHKIVSSNNLSNSTNLARQSAPESKTISACDQKSQARVLAVSNHAPKWQPLYAVLQDAGMECVVFDKGSEVLEMLKNQAFDLVVLDINMPDLAGFEVCKALKANADTQDIPVLFLADNLDSSKCAVGFEAGGQDWLSGNMGRQEIQARISNALRVKALQDELHLKKKISSWERRMLTADHFYTYINNILDSGFGSIQLLSIDNQLSAEQTNLCNTAEKSFVNTHEMIRSISFLTTYISWRPIHIDHITNDVVRWIRASHPYAMNINIIIEPSNLNINEWRASTTYTARSILYILHYLFEMCANLNNAIIRIRKSTADNHASLCLSNNAPSMNEEQRLNIFKPRQPRKHPIDNIGLVVSKKYIEHEGGQLYLAPPSSDVGNEFVFWLPSQQPGS